MQFDADTEQQALKLAEFFGDFVEKANRKGAA